MFSSVIYLVTAAVSIVYAYRKLRKPGISQEVRQIVYQRHVLAILIFVATYSYFFVSVVINWQKQGNGQLDYRSWVLAVLKIIFALQGLIIPMTRFVEPAFWKLIRKSIDRVIFLIVFKRPEKLTEYQQICVNSLCNRGLGDACPISLQQSGDSDEDKPASFIESRENLFKSMATSKKSSSTKPQEVRE